MGLVTGCAPQPPASTAPSPREAELVRTIEELRGKLVAAEQAAEQARAETARALAMAKTEPASPAQTTDAGPPKPEIKIADTSYIVIKKTLTVGQLISKATASNPSLTERRPAQYHITFKGAQSGKEYPPLEVQELAYGRFHEGVAYLPQDINAAKKPALTTGGAVKTAPMATGGASNTPSDAELRALFGN